MKELDAYDLILCDLDGCLISGDTVLPGARDLFARAKEKMVILSNNSTDTPKTLASKLRFLGLPIAPERVYLAGVNALQYIHASYPEAKLAVYGSAAIKAYATEMGIPMSHSNAQVVLLTRDVQFNYAALTQLLQQLRQGAKLVVANQDLHHPDANGNPVPETGSIVEWVKACLPDVQCEVVGKPSALMYQHVLRDVGVQPEQCLCIGDNPRTDGAGAQRMGMDFELVSNAGDSNGLLDLPCFTDLTTA